MGASFLGPFSRYRSRWRLFVFYHGIFIWRRFNALDPKGRLHTKAICILCCWNRVRWMSFFWRIYKIELQASNSFIQDKLSTVTSNLIMCYSMAMDTAALPILACVVKMYPIRKGWPWFWAIIFGTLLWPTKLRTNVRHFVERQNTWHRKLFEKNFILSVLTGGVTVF